MASEKSRTTQQNRKRLLAVFGIVCLLFLALTGRLAYHMIIKGEEYRQMAVKQQTTDRVVTARRGSILDRYGNALASSSTAYTVWVRPDTVKNNGKTENDRIVNIQNEAQALSEYLGMSYDDVYDTITAEKRLIKLAKNVDKEVGEEIRDEGFAGIELIENDRRNYPLGTFASHILGGTNDDNVGMLGVELYYNNYLAGLNGRWIMSKDNRTNALAYGTNRYYAAQDGYDLVLTIDENIQHLVEEQIEAGRERLRADGVMCLIMDPKTCGILAMAQTGSFNANDPRAPLPGDEAKFEAMSSEEKLNYWNKVWRNFNVSDTYEPGSVFKLFTTSLALDYGVTHMNENFYCPGYVQVADWTLHCWNYPAAHGMQSLTQAVSNSCNVTMINLVQRMGIKRFSEGLSGFGLTEKTGIDYPGETLNILHNLNAAGPVELATMSYGQGIAVTPISITTAVCSIANQGQLMQPHLMKELRDSDGNVVSEFQNTVKSISISAQTASDVLGIMEYNVQKGGAGSVKMPGYRVGAKTGTANKPEGGGYSKTDLIGSVVTIAPIDDPKFVMLVIVDVPRTARYGSTSAGPISKAILGDLFRYLDIEPDYSSEELRTLRSQRRTVPDLTGQSLEDAIGICMGRDLDCTVSPEIESYDELSVVDQYPKPGEDVPKGSSVTVYYK